MLRCEDRNRVAVELQFGGKIRPQKMPHAAATLAVQATKTSWTKVTTSRSQGDGERGSDAADSPIGRLAAFQSIAMRIRARPLG